MLNIVHGTGPNVGSAITAHPKVGTISFTGGTVTGRKVAEAGAPLFKKVSLELGGKNPNIIFADADLDAAIAGSLRSSFANQGQVCFAARAFLSNGRSYDEFVRRFVKRRAQLKVGDPLEEGTEQGAIVSQDAAGEGEILCRSRARGRRHDCAGGRRPPPPNDRCRTAIFFRRP